MIEGGFMAKRAIGIALTATMGMGADYASAQDAVLQEVTVTAQKRPETLAQVPIAVSVLGGEQLSQQNVTAIGDLQTLVPNLHVATTPFNPTVNIRGVGSGGGDRTFEQS